MAKCVIAGFVGGNLRGLLALTLALFCYAPHLSAYADPPSASSASHRSAARDALDALFIDNGALELAASRAFELSGRQIWESWSANPGFARLPSEKLEAVRNYLATTYPRQATADIMHHAPSVLDAVTQQFATLLDETELQSLASFMRSPAGRSWFRNALASGDGEYAPTAEEERAVNAFSSTPAGRRWENPAVNDFISNVAERAIAPRALAIRQTMARDICDILGDDCPPGLAASR